MADALKGIYRLSYLISWDRLNFWLNEEVIISRANLIGNSVANVMDVTTKILFE